MLLLSADTSGKNGSIALVQCQPGDSCEILQIVDLQGGTFSAELIPQVAALLARNRFTKQDLGGFAVATGPGSFTGLRVGLAAIKALAEVLQKPIAAVSLLEALAVAASDPGMVVVIIDAGRAQFFAGKYEVLSYARARMISEELIRAEDIGTWANETPLITADSHLLDPLRDQGLDVRAAERPRSDVIARLGWQKIQAGRAVSPDELEANYIRPSDAEIFSKL